MRGLGRDAIRADLLQTQFHARDTGMRSTWRDLDDRIILSQGQPAGRIALARTADEVWIVDLLVLPELRGSGIGTAVLQTVFDDATRLGKPVRLHANIAHRSTRLYERLGFVKAGGSQVHHLLEWTPAQLVGA